MKIETVIESLRDERDLLRLEIERIDEAIKALQGLSKDPEAEGATLPAGQGDGGTAPKKTAGDRGGNSGDQSDQSQKRTRPVWKTPGSGKQKKVCGQCKGTVYVNYKMLNCPACWGKRMLKAAKD